MSKLPSKCLVDTNVPMIANLYERLNSYSDIPDSCISESRRQIENITEKDCCLVIDDAGEIFQEYINNLSRSSKGQPGIGYAFVKWVNDHQWNPDKVDRIQVTKSGNSYKEFPPHNELNNFDPSDRKFVAVANAHPEKPPILQAVDSKWWGWNDALAEVGITVCFLCREYIKAKYEDKDKKGA